MHEPLTRENTWQLLTEYTQNESLLRHALAVEADMRHYARKFGEDEHIWGITGLIHDFDYERYPNAPDHPLQGAAILRGLGWPEYIVEAILGHADYTQVPRTTLLAKTLFAVDELAGFISAAALIRPTKSVLDLEASSVVKRMKDKAFARNVSRDDIRLGAQELQVELNAHIGEVIAAMRGIAPQLGLAGTQAAAPGGE